MNDLILITTNEQGSAVVSGRDLWVFLESKKQFADWMKIRIEKYGFVEGQDYTTFSLISEKGRPTIDYALTLDAAKELAMVEGNAKGKEARQYFIDCEKKLQQSALTSPSAIEQTLVQLLAGHQQLLAQLQADVNELKSDRRKPTTLPAPRPSVPGKQLALPSQRKYTAMPNPVTQYTRFSSLRPLIHQRIDQYCTLHNVAQGDTYNYLYKRLLDVYGINAYRLTRVAQESILDVVERYGHLHELYQLVLSDLSNSTGMSNRKLTFETMHEEDVRLILTLTFNQGDYLRYAELRAILMEASDYLGLRLAKNRAELFIASALKQGYVIKGWEPGQPFERYRLNLPATH